MVKAGPDAQYARFFGKFFIGMGVVFLAFSVFGVLSQVVDALNFSPSSIDFRLFPPLCVPLLFITEGIFFIKIAPRLQHIENRRQEAVSRNTLLVPLAEEQPVPAGDALALPLTIKLGPRWTKIASWSAICWILSAGYMSLAAPSGFGQYRFLLSAIAATVLSLFFGGIIIWMTSHYGWLEISEEGITIQQHKSRETIKWQDTRLFAIHPATPLGGQAHLPVRYELAGAGSSVRWIRLRRKMPFAYTIYWPRTPFDEYDRQMDALLSLIAAKTGAPLYDLR